MADRGLGPLRAYALLAWMWTRAAAQYPASLLLLTCTQFAVTGLDFVAIGLLFAHTPRLAGFSLPELAFLYGSSCVSFGIAYLLLINLDNVGVHIRTGTLDAMLIRPVSPLAQLATEGFTPRRVGRLLQAAVVLAWAVPALEVRWTPGRVLLVPVMIVSGAVIYGALWVLGAAFQVVVADTREVVNAFTYGGNFLTQYPLAIYGRELVHAVTWVVPLAFVNWQPALYLLDRPDPLGLPTVVRFASPAAALLLALVAAAAWRAALRHYRSTGS
ncbi:ABC transporter permease [Carbonactinospora thermoautotrophica]|uniref:ABC transporter permease n=1 Tax=Carbonactinospora thermoautotrophica TaxID=1469144 RepID=UPI00226DF6E6|nr:ABC-2 family transporter protein [Carbonactinospora thermoautotrophica]